MNLEKVYPRVSTCTGPDVLRAASGVHGTRGAGSDDVTAGPVCVANLVEWAVWQAKKHGSLRPQRGYPGDTLRPLECEVAEDAPDTGYN